MHTTALTPDRDDDIVQLFSNISNSKYRELKEVISPTLTIKVVGFFFRWPKIIYKNKMKDTNLNLIGQKNNTCYQSIPNYTTKMDNKNLNFRSK